MGLLGSTPRLANSFRAGASHPPGGHTAIEVKSGSNVSNNDLKSLRAIIEENKLKRHICVCREHLPRKIGEIDVMPYETFLDALWNGEFTT